MEMKRSMVEKGCVVLEDLVAVSEEGWSSGTEESLYAAPLGESLYTPPPLFMCPVEIIWTTGV